MLESALQIHVSCLPLQSLVSFRHSFVYEHLASAAEKPPDLLIIVCYCKYFFFSLAWWSSIGCGVMARGTWQDLAPRSSTRTCVYVFNFMDYRHGLVVAKKSFEFTIWEPPHENQACLIRALHTYALTTLFESKCYIGHHYLFAIFIVWSLTNGRSLNICSIIYLSSLANSTLIILFSNMLKFSKIISSKSKKNCERK